MPPIRVLAAVLAIAIILPQPARSLDFDDYTGPFGGKTKVYGQFSPSVLTADDGSGHRTAVVDAAQSVSRIGLLLVRTPGRRTFHFRFETAFGFRESDQVSQVRMAPAIDWSTGDIRFLEMSWETESLGGVSVGQGSMATDNASAADLSGTGLVTSFSVPHMAGAFRFRSADQSLTGVTVGDAFKTFDGIKRVRFRYDAPTWRGLRLSVAAGAQLVQSRQKDSIADIAVTYQGHHGPVEIQGALGASVSRYSNGTVSTSQVGSVSVLHRPSGWNLTVAGGRDESAGRGHYFKLGRRFDWLRWGDTALSLDHTTYRDRVSAGSKSMAIGVAVTQRIEPANMDLFVGFRRMSYRDGGTPYQDIRAVQLGTRWRF